jgi:hypothetical protein
MAAMSLGHRSGWFFRWLVFLTFFSAASCSYLTGEYEDKDFGLRLKVLEESRKHLKVRLDSNDSYGDGFRVIIGSPSEMKVTRHKSWFSDTYYSATVDMSLTGHKEMIVLETLRGREGDKTKGEASPPQWWTNTLTIGMDPFNGVVTGVSFDGDVLPQKTP